MNHCQWRSNNIFFYYYERGVGVKADDFLTTYYLQNDILIINIEWKCEVSQGDTFPPRHLLDSTDRP